MKRKIKARVMDGKMMSRALSRLSHEIVEHNHGTENVVVIGIRQRGDVLAHRIVNKIKELEGKKLPVGAIDISFYRDDAGKHPLSRAAKGSDVPFDITGKTVVLVDDVLMTGRSTRAALDHLMDYGRPKYIQFAVLVDRGHRELPISADYIGKNLPTSLREDVEVKTVETDGEDSVVIYERRK